MSGDRRLGSSADVGQTSRFEESIMHASDSADTCPSACPYAASNPTGVVPTDRGKFECVPGDRPGVHGIRPILAAPKAAETVGVVEDSERHRTPHGEGAGS